MDIFDIIIGSLFGCIFTIILITYFESYTDKYECKNDIKTDVIVWLDNFDQNKFKFWSDDHFNGDSGSYTIHVSKKFSDKELSIYKCGYDNGRQSKV